MSVRKNIAEMTRILQRFERELLPRLADQFDYSNRDADDELVVDVDWDAEAKEQEEWARRMRGEFEEKDFEVKDASE